MRSSVMLSKRCKEWVAGVERSEPPECIMSGGSPLVPRGSTPATPNIASFLQRDTSDRSSDISVACSGLLVHEYAVGIFLCPADRVKSS